MLITIFTPSYNRAKYLPILYNSLLNQTYKNFEWIVVDDGSLDDTKEIIEKFSDEQKITIVYRKQSNYGKHIAMNYGASLAQGELFYVVDSDDYLVADSLERIMYHWREVERLPVEDRNCIIGLAGNIVYPSGEIVGGTPQYDVVTTDLIDYRFCRKVKGDKAEIYLTEIVRQNPFPKIVNETFCPEALIFYRLANQGLKLRFFNENIYVCDYLEGGLSLNGLKTIERGPIASLQSYADVTRFINVPANIRLKYAILFWRVSHLSKKQSFSKILNMLPSKAYLLLYPLGLVFHFKDKLQGKV